MHANHTPVAPVAPVSLGLGIYAFFARRRPRTYLGKIMLVAFLGTHVPLLTLFCYAITTTDLPASDKRTILIVALIATLAGTAITLFTLHKLLAPITATFMGLRSYLESNTKPQLPTQFTDEAGVLMADTMYTIDKLDETIQHLKHYDGLTALPNRTLFHARLTAALQQQQDEEGSAVAVLLLDLEGFSNLNSNLGQETGDLLLRQVAQRMAAVEEEGRLIARFGGDEFAVLYDDHGTSTALISQAKKILAALNRPFQLNGHDHYLTVSIGIATLTNSQENADAVLANADIALRVAKQQGRNSIQFFLTEMNQTLHHRLELERDMRKALDRGEFALHYQPQIDLHTGRIIGAEALLRWQHPEKGFISPVDIIPVAEESGMILPIGEWVLQEACRQNQTWQAAGLDAIRMAVNLSAAQFQAVDLIALVSDTLAATGLNPNCLELEITESLLMEDVENAIRMLEALRGLGTTVALDDFGTGYSSLSYLKRFPLHYLKIDRSFVSGVPDDQNDAAIVSAIVAMAQSLQLDVIAEGVETEAQAHYLQKIGCSTFQGYYYSKPVPAADFEQLLANNSNAPAIPTWSSVVPPKHRTFQYRQQQHRPLPVS